MKPTTTRSSLLILGASLPLLAVPALAADQTYDDSSASNVWDLATLNWDAGAAVWTDGNNAIFGGTGEPVAVNAAVAVGDMTFNADGYELANGSAAALTLNGGSISVTTAAHLATVNEVLAGSAGFTKAGAGILHLRNANSYTGDTAINAGIVRIGDGTTKTFLGADSPAGANRAIVAGGATLQVVGNNTRYDRKEVHLSGAGAGGLGALYVDASGTTNGIRLNHNNTTPATTLLDADATIRIDGAGASAANAATVLMGRMNLGGFTLTKSGTGALGFEITGNSITGGGKLDIAEGVVKSNQNNTFNNNFDLEIDAGAALWVHQTGNVVNATTSTLTLNGTLVLNARGNGTAGSDTTNAANKIGNLAGNGTITSGIWGNTGTNTLTLEPSADFTFGGTITQANGTVNLVKAGAAIVTLTGTNSYNGSTSVNGGELVFGNGGSGGAPGGGGVSVASGSVLSVNRSATTTVAGNFSGSGTFNQNGAGAVFFNGTDNTFFGPTNVNAGRVFVKNASAYGDAFSGLVTVAPGAAFGASGTVNALLTVPGGLSPATAATIDLTNTDIGTMNLVEIFTPLTVGNAAAGEATYLKAEAGASAADKLQLDGDLVVELGGLRIEVVGLGIAAGQTYDLITFNSASGDGFATGSGTAVGGIELVNPNISFGVTGSLVVTANAVQLVTSGASAPAAAYWSGSKGGSWTSSSGGQGNFTTTAAGSTFIGAFPGSTTDVFFSNDSPSNLTHTLGANFAVNRLTFRGTSAAASIGGTEQLSIQAGGIELEAGNGGATLGMAALSLGESQTWTNGSANPLVVTAAVNGGINDLTLAGNAIVLGGSSFGTGSLTVNAALDVAGTGIATGSFAGSGSVTNTGAPATLTATVDFDSEFTGTLDDAGAGSALSLVKDGFGQLTLGGANSHNGAVTINGGIVKLGNASALGATGVQTVINSGGTLDLAGQTITEALFVTGTGNFGAGALINSDTANPAVVSYEIDNGSPFAVGGDGALTLQRARFSGPTVVSMVGAGTVTLGNEATTSHFNLMALDHTSAGTVNLGLSGSDSIVCDRGLRVSGGGTVRLTGTSNRLLVENCEVVLTHGTLDLNGDSLLGQDNAIGGNGGAGRVTLGDGFTDGVISGGAASVLELHTGSGSFASNTAGTPGFEARSGSVDVTLAGAASIPFNKTTAGTVSLLQNNSLLGKTTVTEGTLTMAHACLADTADLEITTTVGAGGFLNLTHGATDVVAGLIVDGTPVAVDGSTYGGTGSGADHIVSYITGTGKIQVGGAGGYASWALDKGLTAGVNDGINDDPDLDGIVNLLEYVLGGLPIGAGASDTSILPDQTLTTTDIVLTFHRSDLSESDTTLKVQWSADLATWGAPNEVTIGADDLGIVNVTEDSPTAELDTIEVSVPRGLSGKLFVRVIATQP